MLALSTLQEYTTIKESGLNYIMVDIKYTNEDITEANPLQSAMLNSLLVPKYTIDSSLTERPLESFQLLMLWVQENFAGDLTDGDNLTSFIHNRISIDENFVLYAAESKLKIECLYKDSVISWSDKDKFEKFFSQGVFKVYSKKVEFLVSALFHKGCNNEDEVSFFITSTADNFDQYLEIRNGFDEWVKLRDREAKEIHVVDGENIPYTNEHTWDKLFLPAGMKNELKEVIEVFLQSKDWYLDNDIPWKKGIFLHGVQGNGKTSIIKTIISEYDFKPVTICPGGGTDTVEEAFRYSESQSPAVLYLEDLDSLIASGQVEHSSFLNFMDGVASKNGLLVIATANYPDRLPPNITDRPSRFDRKFEIPVPDKALTYKYLKMLFGNKIKPPTLKKIAAQCFKEELTYAYLKELYVSTMFGTIAQKRHTPRTSDIEHALERIIDERILINGAPPNVNEYLE